MVRSTLNLLLGFLCCISVYGCGEESIDFRPKKPDGELLHSQPLSSEERLHLALNYGAKRDEALLKFIKDSDNSLELKKKAAQALFGGEVQATTLLDLIDWINAQENKALLKRRSNLEWVDLLVILRKKLSLLAQQGPELIVEALSKSNNEESRRYLVRLLVGAGSAADSSLGDALRSNVNNSTTLAAFLPAAERLNSQQIEQDLVEAFFLALDKNSFYSWAYPFPEGAALIAKSLFRRPALTIVSLSVVFESFFEKNLAFEAQEALGSRYHLEDISEELAVFCQKRLDRMFALDLFVDEATEPLGLLAGNIHLSQNSPLIFSFVENLLSVTNVHLRTVAADLVLRHDSQAGLFEDQIMSAYKASISSSRRVSLGEIEFRARLLELLGKIDGLKEISIQKLKQLVILDEPPNFSLIIYLDEKSEGKILDLEFRSRFKKFNETRGL